MIPSLRPPRLLARTALLLGRDKPVKAAPAAPKPQTTPQRRPAHAQRHQRALGPSSDHARPLSPAAILAILALVLNWLAQALEWSGATPGAASNTIEPTGSNFPSWLSYFALAIFVCAGVLGALRFWRRLPRLIPFFLAAMLAYGTFWVIVGFEPAEYKNAFGTIGPLVFVMCLGVYAGLDSSLWRALRPILLALAYASVALAAYYTVRLQVAVSFEGPTPMNQHMPTALWLAFAALILGRSSGWRENLLAVVPIALCVPIALLMASRSWTLLAILAFVLGLKITFQRRLRLRPAKTLALGVLSMALLAAAICLLSMAFPERIETLAGRLLEDSRTGQYSDFFHQVPLTGLIAGLGPKATYTAGGEADFNYIDNQFLFILFKFGLPVLLGYCAVVIWPGLRLLVKAANRRERSFGFFFAFWTLATLGVSIFHGITNNPQNFVVILLAGRCFHFMTSEGKSAATAREPLKSLGSEAIPRNDTPGLGSPARTPGTRQDPERHGHHGRSPAKTPNRRRVFILWR
jgi:O-antigen ligase